MASGLHDAYLHAADLAALHQSLAEALGEMERLGEFTAAAHLTAALDLIEDLMDARAAGMKAVAEARNSAVFIIARQMLDVFGDRAEAVARRQLASAVGASLTSWAAIVNEIAA